METNIKITNEASVCTIDIEGVIGVPEGEQFGDSVHSVATYERLREEVARIKNIDAKEYNDLFCNPYNAASYGYIDDIIEPRNTRFRVIRALEQLAGKQQENPWKKHDNLPL